MISIVMGLWNRELQLNRTLESIKKSAYTDYEIIIVDDASDIPYKTDFEKARVFRIDKKDKFWVNPCVAYNIGFKQAKGDIIIIQNPECRHEGDVLTYVANNIAPNTYLSISCYDANQLLSELINKNEKPDFLTINNQSHAHLWMNHPYYNPINFHFCTAITKKDLDELNGFDERYASGIAFDDTEFIRRIYRKRMNIVASEYPFVFHQWHDRNHWANKALQDKNERLYEKEYYPREKNELTQKIKPKLRGNTPMKLGVSYNVFDGCELLRDSILSIRNQVDHISIVFQSISNTGNPGKPDDYDLIMSFLEEGLIDDLVYYVPSLTIPASANELNKRNMGYVNSYNNGCTHHLSMDCDEFYEESQFLAAKVFIHKNGYDSSACQMVTYYKNNETILHPPESYFVPFIYKIRPELCYEFTMWPVVADPTRRIKPGKFYQFDRVTLQMHHFSYVRKDLRSKLVNSSASVNFTPEKIENIINHYEKWVPGEKALIAPAAYFQTTSVKAKFLQSWNFSSK